MNKYLGIVSSMLTLAVAAMLFTGCSDCCLDTSQPTCHEAKPACHVEPACAPACKPACAPAHKPACAPACAPVCHPPAKCCHPNSNILECLDGITVRAKNPECCCLGNQYSIEFTVEACDDVCEAVVMTTLPEGVTYKKSEPPAKVDGRKLTWDFGAMNRGESRPAAVWVECDTEGELCACFCARATRVRFCSLLCAKPVLACHKCGPEEVCPCDPVTYVISVTNTGTGTAHDVIVTDNVPEGMEHASGQKTLTYKLCELQPCETKEVQVCLTAVKRGNFCNTAVVTACDADSVSCKACTCVCICDVALEKTGPKEAQIGKNADYQITVTNTGDKNLTNVRVTDTAPCETSIVTANGAAMNGNQAVWTVNEIKPGEKVSFSLTLTTCTPGCYTNNVGVTTCEGCCASSCVTTLWRGKPAFNMCICDTNDPICIGECTSYCVTVVNQGYEADDNVKLVLRFPAEVVPVSTSGDNPGTISGNTVTFGPVNNFGAHQSLKFWVDAKGVKSGDARIVVELTSNTVQTPIVQQESTIVN